MPRPEGFYLEVSDTSTGMKVLGRYFQTSTASVGRRASCDIVIDRGFISSKHLEIYQRKGAFEIRDLDSQNGVYTRGRRVKPGTRVVLAKPAQFSIGPLEFKVRREQPTSHTVTVQKKNSRVVANGEVRTNFPTQDTLAAAYQKLEAARSQWEQQVRSTFEGQDTKRSEELLRAYPKRDWAYLHSASDFLIEGKLHTVLVAVLRELAPSVSPPVTEEDAERVIEHFGEVIRLFVRCLVVVQRDVASEVASYRVAPDATPTDEEHFLAQLLNWRRALDRGSVERHVRRDITTLRQMLSASITAGHALFVSVSPAEVARSTPRRWPTRGMVLWNYYKKLYRTKAGEGYTKLTETFREAFMSEYSRLEKDRQGAMQ